MVDFLIPSIEKNKKTISIYPKFVIKHNISDLMIRGKAFYAIYNEDTGKWSTDEGIALRIIDKELSEYKEQVDKRENVITDAEDRHKVHVEHMWDADSGSIVRWQNYTNRYMSDTFHQLDENIYFSNDTTTKEDYSSKELPYPLEEGECPAYEKLISTLYSDKERQKLEWAIGSIIQGDSKRLQKFIVLYGSAGSGKSTVLNIIQQLFEGYYCTFDSKSLTSSNNSFALESFKSNPLVGIQHDGDLSKIEDNTKLNSIVSHEFMEVNEKYKSKYVSKFNTFLFMGTNKPVKITEAKSGLLRRLIDVCPTGNKVPLAEYNILMNKIKFELGAIASHCLSVYKELGYGYYDSYVPQEMMSATNDFYDFMDNYYDYFKDKPFVTLKEVWKIYKTYCEYANLMYSMNMRNVRVELRNYFTEYKDQILLNGEHYRNVYFKFRTDKFIKPVLDNEQAVQEEWLDMEEQESVFDKLYKNCPAQLATASGTPKTAWVNVKTKLSDINTHELHWVKPEENHIFIDFDLKNEKGDKDYEINKAEAIKWPKTYAELSKGGQGIHLHYIYNGDISQISNLYDTDIEIKKFVGNSSLRRKLTKCNSENIATISSGLPTKGVKMINLNTIQTEKVLRTFIENCLSKKHHGATKPEIDFLKKTMEACYASGMKYDVSDMKSQILAFATESTNQALACIKIANNLPYHSDEPCEESGYDDDTKVFFDLEVYPNLLLICYKAEDADECITMINPRPEEVKDLVKFKLIGFNNRRYDNHILYAAMLGYNNDEIYRVSKQIISGNKDAFFRNAYNLSYTDVYDFASAGHKQSLKKFEIELGIHHKEMYLPWDKPAPEDTWDEVAEYCKNDVIATQEVFNYLKSDWVAREILAEIADMSVNTSTNSLTTKIIFDGDKHPNLVYTDLATGEQRDSENHLLDTKSIPFVGYEYINGKNMYRGEDCGRGGYVYSKPGMYKDVVLLDIASMHPTSIVILNLFGEYTKRFKDIKDARLYIKHKEYDKTKKMFDGKLTPYLGDDSEAKALSTALKTAINSVYGLTSARFDNVFKDVRNKNNIVALRGALFMVDLKHALADKGYDLIHIKTDSVKIANCTQEAIDFVMDFGEKYGYTFELEDTYEKLCIIDNTNYVAKYKDKDEWTSTGKRFSIPYIFKTMFSKEKITFEDLCETKAVQTSLYLDMNEDLKEDEHAYKFVGKVGSFCPVNAGKGGGILLRQDKEDPDKFSAVQGTIKEDGTTRYRWLEAEMTKELDLDKDIDMDYYNALVDDIIDTINEYGSCDEFIS